MKVIMRPLVLQVWVRVRADTLRVIYLHVRIICPQHVNYYQVDYSLFPRENNRILEILSSIQFILFDVVHSTLVRHVPLSHQVRKRIELEKDQIWHVLSNYVDKEVQMFLLIRYLRQCE